MLKKITLTLIKPIVEKYLRKKRTYTYKGIKLEISPSVFHPRFFFSTKILFSFVNKLNLMNSKFLEIGCGSGLISLLAYQKKAKVTTIDINSFAIKNTKDNFIKNFGSKSESFKVIHSDLFSKVKKEIFDYVVINPPYFFEKIESRDQFAWNCGKNGEYFNKLFNQISEYIDNNSKVYMILADVTDIDRIKNIAKEKNYQMNISFQKKLLWETNYVFEIVC